MSINHKRTVRLCAGVLCLLLLFSAMPQKALATERIETDRNVSLTLSYRAEGKPVTGVSFALYRIADVSSVARFTLADGFEAYPVSLENLDSASWKNLAGTLAGYVARDGIASLDSGKIDQTGLLRFPILQAEMKTGLYLVIGERSTVGRYTYTAEPFLISLPNLNSADQWEYEVTASPKYDSRYHPPSGGGDNTTDLKVLKVWEDDGNKNERPPEIIAQLLRDGSVFSTVTLNAVNNWRHTWTALGADYRWQVVEKSLSDGYTVSIGREGITFVITNTFHPEDPDKPVGPEDPDEPDKPDESDKPDKPDKPGVGIPDSSIPGGGLEAGSNQPGRLPQTGMLWWPVPVLAGGGMLIFILGWVKRRQQSGTGDE